MPRDIDILRDLAKRYADVCAHPAQRERRDLWQRLNSLQPTRPLIYVRAFAWHEVMAVDPASRLQCEDPFYRQYESSLRHLLFWSTLGDDSIFEPWMTVRASLGIDRARRWGPEMRYIRPDTEGGAWKGDHPIKTLEDMDNLVRHPHHIDEQATAADAARLRDALGDIVAVNVDRSPFFWIWGYDLSTDLGHLRGIEQVMWDMMDNPKWLHKLMGFMRDTVLAQHDQAEGAGDIRLSSSYNQAMAYSQELPDPQANGAGVRRDRIWAFFASQELTLVSPAMHDEFMLQYQLPLMRKFGLTSYGCCEDLTEKIDMLRQVPNLRRIAVAPRANVRRCAEQIGRDYVMSYRPNPAEMISCGFDREHVRQFIRRDLDLCNGCHVDITLKDVETIERDPTRPRQWVKVVREAIGA